MGREDPQLKLRLPDGLRDRIKADAERNGRSMNAEIVARLTGGSPLEAADLALELIEASRAISELFLEHAQNRLRFTRATIRILDAYREAGLAPAPDQAKALLDQVFDTLRDEISAERPDTKMADRVADRLRDLAAKLNPIPDRF